MPGVSLEVRVATLAGLSYKVNADDSWTLFQLKKSIQGLSGVPSREQRLISGSTLLLDDGVLLRSLVTKNPTETDSPQSASSNFGCDCEAADEGLELTLVRRTMQQAVWLERVGHLGIMLYDVPKDLKADRELVLTAVRRNEEAFQYADATLQMDKGFVLSAVCTNACVMPYVSRAMRADRDVVLAAVSRRGEVLACVNPEFRSDYEVVMQAVKQHGLALRYAAESLRGDRCLAIAAVEQNAAAVAYASEELRADEEVRSAAMRSKVDALDDEGRGKPNWNERGRLVDEAEVFDNWLVL